jgi:hypothetical protein
VKELVIRDPYCGAANHRLKLKVFLEALTTILGTVDHLAIHCRETRDKDGYVEFYLDVERHVDDLVKSIGFINRHVQVSPSREPPVPSTIERSTYLQCQTTAVTCYTATF